MKQPKFLILVCMLFSSSIFAMHNNALYHALRAELLFAENAVKASNFLVSMRLVSNVQARSAALTDDKSKSSIDSHCFFVNGHILFLSQQPESAKKLLVEVVDNPDTDQAVRTKSLTLLAQIMAAS